LMILPIGVAFLAWLNLRFMTYEVTSQRYRGRALSPKQDAIYAVGLLVWRRSLR
jgi:hypothetical protein